ADGVQGGLQGGFNWQAGRRVIGLEGEFGYLDLNRQKFPPGVDPILNAPYDAAGTLDSGWYAGLGARLGYAFGRTLLYSKAGGVWSAAKIGYLDTCITAPCGNGTLDASDRAG